MDWILLIISIFLLLAVIGLGIWIFFLYRKPPCTANAALCNSYCSANCNTICPTNPTNTKPVPYTIYSVGNNYRGCLTTNNSNLKGIMAQTNPTGTVQIVASNNTSNPVCQWYILPSSVANQVIIQNVGSGGYVNINGKTVTVQSSVSNATSLIWQIDKNTNINYFVLVNNTCSNGYSYVSFTGDGSNGSNVQNECGGATAYWFTNAVSQLPVE
jgi:hypothetical protein